MAALRRIGVEQRRARLALRHRLAPAAHATEPDELARDLVGLHGTDPASVFLAAWARLRAPEVEAIQRALYEERTLLRILGMRRTMFVVAVDLLPVVHAACTRAIAAQQRKLLLQLLAQAGIADHPEGWLRDVEQATVRALAGRGEALAAELSQDVPGLTAGAVKRALSEIGPSEVELDGGTGLVLPDDLEPVPVPAPWAALLPALDPTAMGWSGRAWYLGEHGPALFDRSGNVGPTVWWQGRIVGGWAQRKDGEIVLRLLEDVGADASAAVEAEAERLGGWFGAVRVRPRFRTPLERELTA